MLVYFVECFICIIFAVVLLFHGPVVRLLEAFRNVLAVGGTL